MKLKTTNNQLLPKKTKKKECVVQSSLEYGRERITIPIVVVVNPIIMYGLQMTIKKNDSITNF